MTPPIFCSACGQQQPQTAYCYKCGFRLPVVQLPPLQRSAVVQPVAPKPRLTAREKYPPWFIVMISIVGFVLFVITCMVALSRSGEIRSPRNSFAAPSVESPPTATATPKWEPSHLLYASKKLLEFDYDKGRYEQAKEYLSQIPKEAKEYKQAAVLFTKAVNRISSEESAGPPPEVSAYDGKVYCVTSYLRNTLNDYDSAEFLQWSAVSKVKYKNQSYWQVTLRLRAKNAFGGKIIAVKTFLIQHGVVVLDLDQ